MAHQAISENSPVEAARAILKDYTAYSVAKRSGLPITTVQRFMVEGVNPRSDYLHRMLKAVGKTVVLGAKVPTGTTMCPVCDD